MSFLRPPATFLILALLSVGVSRPASAGQAGAAVELSAAKEPSAEIETLLDQARSLEGSETKLALEKAQAALALSRRAGRKELELRSLLQAGRLQRLLSDVPGGMRSVQEGMDLATGLNDQHTLGELFLLRGLIEWNQAKLPEATVSMMEASRRGEALGDQGLQIGALYGRGIVRARGEDLDGGLENLQAALRLAEGAGDVRLGQILNAVGVIFLQRKDYPQAHAYFERALAALRSGTNLRTTAYVQINLGQIAVETGDQEAAGNYLDTAMRACERYGFRRGVADVYYLRGARERRLGHLEEALKQLGLAVELAEKLNQPDLFVQVYGEYIQVEQARGDYRAALEYNHKLADKLEIVRGERTRREATEIQARYEAERHAREIMTLRRARDIRQADLAIKAVKLDQAQSGYTFLVGTMVLGGITMAALASRQRANTRLAGRMLAETRAAKLAVETEDARKSELLNAAARDLLASEERFRNAFEHSPLGLCLVALDGRWLRVNPAMCNIVGCTEEHLLGTTFQAITHPEDLDSDLQLLTRLLAGTINSYSLEKRYLRQAGHFVWVRIDVTLVRQSGDGRPAYFISQVDDITERRRVREHLRIAKEVAEKANEAKNGFLSRMSHELRTPLNAILGFGQLLECEDLGERQNQSVGHICVAGRHLLDLINEVLDISQMESGQLVISTEPTSVEEAMRGAVCLMEPLAREAGLKLTLVPEGGLPLYIRAEPRRLKQVILNLLSNAIKYNHPGGEVSVRCATKNGRVCIEIADTGPGIAAADLETIFTAFTRLAATESTPGTGLGLSVAKALTEVMGGRVYVASEAGAGSTFTLEFDLLSEEEAAQESLVMLDALPAGFYGEPTHETTVLYIEDITENIELVRYVFDTMPGFRLIHACTGKAGVEMARAELPGLILLDLNLPDIPGAAALAQLRHEPLLADVPVIVLSADASMGQAETLRSLGAREYLTHPLDLKQFRRLVEEAVLVGKGA